MFLYDAFVAAINFELFEKCRGKGHCPSAPLRIGLGYVNKYTLQYILCHKFVRKYENGKPMRNIIYNS